MLISLDSDLWLEFTLTVLIIRSKGFAFLFKVRNSINILLTVVQSINNVETRAGKAGVSRRWLCKAMKEMYGKPPKIILREVKYEKLVRLILSEGIDASSYLLQLMQDLEKQNKYPCF